MNAKGVLLLEEVDGLADGGELVLDFLAKGVLLFAVGNDPLFG